MKESIETLATKDYLGETFEEIRLDIRSSKKEMIKIMFLLAVAYELTLVGFLLIV